MRKIAFTGLAVLSIMLGVVVPAKAATGPAARLSAVAASATRLSATAAPAPTIGPAGTMIDPSVSGSRVSCASATNCLAVSQNVDSAGDATPVADAWNGTAWKALAVPLPKGATGGLNTVSCKQASCLAIGYYSTETGDHTLAWKWNGKSLTPAAAPPLPAGAVDASLGGVSCATASSCVMIGSVSASSGTAHVVIDTWNGAKWTMRTAAFPSGMPLVQFYGLSCVSASYCVAGGMFISASSNSFAIEPLVATWNGKLFKTAKAPAPKGAAEPMITDVSCVSATSCAATGVSFSPSGATSYGFTDTLTGTTWKAAAIAWPKGSASSILLGVSCTSSKSCVAVGADGIANASSANSGHDAALSYDGKAWTVQKTVPLPGSGNVSMFGGVSCATATKCVASGMIGKVKGNAATPLNGVWNGASWKLFRLP